MELWGAIHLGLNSRCLYGTTRLLLVVALKGFYAEDELPWGILRLLFDLLRGYGSDIAKG